MRILSLDATRHRDLKTMIHRPKASLREVRRARIILARAEGRSQQQTAAQVGVNRPVVAKWERRFRDQGLAGLAQAWHACIRAGAWTNPCSGLMTCSRVCCVA